MPQSEFLVQSFALNYVNSTNLQKDSYVTIHFQHITQHHFLILSTRKFAFPQYYIVTLSKRFDNTQFITQKPLDMKHEDETFTSGLPALDNKILMTLLVYDLGIAMDRYILWENDLLSFILKLQATYSSLTRTDITMLLLIRMNFTYAQISQMLHILPSSFRMHRWRLKQKLRLPGTDLIDFVMKL